jgi:dihydrofolate synthase/folylpolyglutamate synthase
MLEAIYLQAGYKTGVYTSPHLVQFEERCRLLGESPPASKFAKAFEKVEQARGEISLTYFEFSTLAILNMMAEAELDVVILEVGLGGRLDAVNLVDAECAIITSIDLDHTALLGCDRETIGLEKAGIMRAGKSVVLSDPVPPRSIIQHAKNLGADIWLMGQDFNFSGDQLQWSWAGRGRRYSGLAYPALRGANQLLNASGVLAALEIMRPQLPVTAQAIRNGLAMVELTGRFQIVPGEPVLVLDVAHNPHSVAALAANLDAMGFYPCTHAVFGAMADKDLPSMLKKVLPMVDAWYFTDLPLPRASTSVQLEGQWRQMNTRSDVKASQHASPQKALDAAIAAASPTDRILVFGSFYTVGGVLQNGIPKLHAKHLGN